MSEPQGSGAEPPATGVGRGRTWALTIILAAMMATLAYRLYHEPPLEAFERPVASTVRVQERNLLIDDDTANPTWRWLRAMVAGSDDETRREAVAAYREALAFVDGHPRGEDTTRSPGPLLVRLAVTLLESGRAEEVRPILARLDSEEGESALAAALVRFAYGLGGRAGDDERAALANLLRRAQAPEPSWTGLQVAARLAERQGQPERAAAARSALTGLGERHGGRVTALGAAYYALVLAGLACLIMGGLRRRQEGFQPFVALAGGLPRAPWRFDDGWAVAVRAAGAGVMVTFFALIVVQGALGVEQVPVLTLLAGLPMLFMIERQLLAPAGVPLRPAFGLDARPTTALAAATLGLLALEQGLVILVTYVGHRLGHDSSWTSSVEETLIFGSPAAVASQILDMVVAAPVLEEIGFRGLVYGTLRTRLGVWPAALVSAAVFAALHPYSLAGCLSLFVGAVASALVYERTRSLVPSIAAHAANNAFPVLVELLLYR
jgi:membrane protease YdiL (CAAX protease family)